LWEKHFNTFDLFCCDFLNFNILSNFPIFL